MAAGEEFQAAGPQTTKPQELLVKSLYVYVPVCVNTCVGWAQGKVSK